MIINSKFKDYYDYFAHQYRDEKVVYNRKRQVLDISCDPNRYSDLLKFHKLYTWGPLTWEWNSKTKSNYEGECNILLIGGKAYPFTNVAGEPFVYDFKTPYDYFDKAVKEQKYLARHYSKLVSGERNENAVALCQKYAPIMIFWGRERQYKARNVEFNPQLKDLGCPASTWEIFQDIGSVLGANEPHIPEMTNKDKIESAGFDLKESFRNRK